MMAIRADFDDAALLIDADEREELLVGMVLVLCNTVDFLSGCFFGEKRAPLPSAWVMIFSRRRFPFEMA